MVKREVVVGNRYGLESKAAAIFIQKASCYKSNVWIEKGDKRANAKSLLGLLSLGIGDGSKITLVIDGEDEEKAMEELVEYTTTGNGDNG